MKRIHIVGCSPRSGTTLMAEMMYNCFDIDLYKEKEARIAVCPNRSGKVFLTKSPKDIIVVRDILHLMTNLYVIYILRDPRDIIVSKHPWDKDRYWSSLKFWKVFTPFGNELLHHPRFITIRYEDLVSNPDEVQRYIQRRLPFLKQTGMFSDFHEHANPSPDYVDALVGVRPVSTGSVGNWRNHKERVLGQLRKHGSISEQLIGYGYERDDAWEQELNGVKPDLKESHPAAFSSEAFIRQKLRWNKLRAWRMILGHSPLVVGMRELYYRTWIVFRGKS